MARRTAGRVLAAGALLGLVAVVPVVANADTRVSGTSGVANAGVANPAGANPSATAAPDAPSDSGSILLLLVAGSIGTMGLLSREPWPGDRQAGGDAGR